MGKENLLYRPGLVVRLYNGLEHEEAGARLTFANEIACASYVDLLERDCAPVEHDAHTVTVEPVGHCRFVTVYVEL